METKLNHSQVIRFQNNFKKVYASFYLVGETKALSFSNDSNLDLKNNRKQTHVEQPYKPEQHEHKQQWEISTETET